MTTNCRNWSPFGLEPQQSQGITLSEGLRNFGLGVHLNAVQHRISRWFYRHSPGGDKDYEFRRRELLAWVPQLTDRWTDFNTSYIGIVLLEFTR